MRLQDRDRALLQKIQLIHQNPDTALNPKRTVRDIVGRPMRHFRGLGGSRLASAVIDLLEQIELGERYLDRFPGELSGGQKQRICIARALAARPELIICDEVTSALDQLVQEEILKLLMSIQQDSNMTFIFITHDIATVRAIADEVVVMNKGRVVEQGLKTDVLNPPYPAYTELLLSSVPEMNADWLTSVIRRRKIGDRASA
jgi:peptide/nickel transport system ATP-binding protein